MTAFYITLDQLAVLAIMGAIGYFIKKKGYINDVGISALSLVLLNICMPCVVLNSTQIDFTKERLFNAIITMGAFLLFMWIGFFLARFVARALHLRPDEEKVWVAGGMMSNGVFIGMPILVALFGDDCAFYISFGSVAFNLVTYGFVVQYLHGVFIKMTVKDFLRYVFHTPVLIACFLGFICFVLQLRFPGPIMKATGYFAAATTPISMLVLGSLVSRLPFKEIFSGRNVYLFALLRLFIIPLVTFFILRLFLQDNLMCRNVAVLTAAMPVATSVPVLTDQFAGCGDLGAKYCIMTTILALISLPMLSALVHVL